MNHLTNGQIIELLVAGRADTVDIYLKQMHENALDNGMEFDAELSQATMTRVNQNVMHQYLVANLQPNVIPDLDNVPCLVVGDGRLQAQNYGNPEHVLAQKTCAVSFALYNFCHYMERSHLSLNHPAAKALAEIGGLDLEAEWETYVATNEHLRDAPKTMAELAATLNLHLYTTDDVVITNLVAGGNNTIRELAEKSGITLTDELVWDVDTKTIVVSPIVTNTTIN